MKLQKLKIYFKNYENERDDFVTNVLKFSQA